MEREEAPAMSDMMMSLEPSPDGILLVLGAIVAAVITTRLLLAAPQARQLRRLEDAARRISAGELEVRAEVSPGGAVGSLAARLNFMAERVESLLDEQRQLIRAISHELRTPTARIRFGLENLAMARNSTDRERRIAAIDEDLVKLEELVEELLIYTRTGAATRVLNRETILVTPVVGRMVERMKRLRPELSLAVDAPRGEGSRVDADARHFERAIQNLLTNAIRYAERRVLVAVRDRRSRVIVEVRDDGPGVPPGQRARIFEPFARVDQSRSRSSGGAGLGLALVKRIMEIHGGGVEVGDAEEGGARFSTDWPAAAARPGANRGGRNAERRDRRPDVRPR
jgi:two-component system sensor histidine kinase RstB